MKRPKQPKPLKIRLDIQIEGEDGMNQFAQMLRTLYDHGFQAQVKRLVTMLIGAAKQHNIAIPADLEAFAARTTDANVSGGNQGNSYRVKAASWRRPTKPRRSPRVTVTWSSGQTWSSWKPSPSRTSAMDKIPKLFQLACEFGAAMGWENISLSPGCQEMPIDDQWWFAINPHNEPNACSHGPKVPPYSIYFEFNGWPAGYLNAGGGVLAAGAIANETTLEAAIEGAIRATGRPRW